MRAETTRHVTWVGVELADPALYARYREAMAPLLAARGGRFDHDFEIARVLRSCAGERLDRVFAISFPSLTARRAFFADERYRQIRAELFAPAVARYETLATFTEGAIGGDDG
jgi:uncharacterized protein (DUF1330 family)